MSKVTIVDTGPLVAFLAAQDRHHQWAAEAFEAASGRLVSCEAVVSEACFIVARDGHCWSVVLELTERMGVEMQPLGSEFSVLRRMMEKYATVPMSFADACLVRLAELHHDSVVLTCDTDFEVYRKGNRRVVETLMPR